VNLIEKSKGKRKRKKKGKRKDGSARKKVWIKDIGLDVAYEFGILIFLVSIAH